LLKALEKDPAIIDNDLDRMLKAWYNRKVPPELVPIVTHIFANCKKSKVSEDFDF